MAFNSPLELLGKSFYPLPNLGNHNINIPTSLPNISPFQRQLSKFLISGVFIDLKLNNRILFKNHYTFERKRTSLRTGLFKDALLNFNVLKFRLKFFVERESWSDSRLCVKDSELFFDFLLLGRCLPLG